MATPRLRSDAELDRRTVDAAAVRDALSAEGVLQWLSAGALLGAHRDGDWIRWDWDVEIHVQAEQAEPRIEQVAGRLAAQGFRTVWLPFRCGFRLHCRRDEAVNVQGYDVWGDRRRKSRFVLPADVWDLDVTVTVRGETFPAQAPIERTLQWMYGDWRTPVRSTRHDVYLAGPFRLARNDKGTTMKITLLTSVAGKDFSFSSGDVVEWDEVDAERMIAAGIAERVTPKRAPRRKPAETAQVQAAETTEA